MCNAFISYLHTVDDKFALSLQIALQKFAKPWYKKATPNFSGINKVFQLHPNYGIILPMHSKWVNKEIECCIENKPINSILVVLKDGKLEWGDQNNCFSLHNPILKKKY